MLYECKTVYNADRNIQKGDTFVETASLNINVQAEHVNEIRKSYFDGGLLSLIGWQILGFLITMFTLGICYPWALCMVYGWKINHTVI
jgi:uncharacterized membrane protein YjgN (DUF898 family)